MTGYVGDGVRGDDVPPDGVRGDDVPPDGVRGGEGSPVDFAGMFRALPTAYLVMTPDLVIVDANDAYLDLLDRTRADLIGRPVFDVFPPTADALDDDGVNPVWASFERARTSGRPDPMPISRYGVVDPVTGEVVERYWSLISAPVLDRGGATALILQRVEDVTDYVHERDGRQAEVARGQLWQRRVETVEADLFARMEELHVVQGAKDVTARRLASLGTMALELTAAETVEDLERIVGQGLSVLGADGGAVISPAAEGGWRITTSASFGQEVQVAYGRAPWDSPLPACWTARTGRRLLLAGPEAGLAFHDVMARVYRDTGRQGWAFLPLTVREECLGSLAVSWLDPHQLTPDELDLLDALAAQCAQTLERIRATQAQRQAATAALRMSEALQRSFLTQPPTPDSVRIAVRYQPATELAQVGGDWYDAFKTAAGATLLVVGDVTGHDREAAAAMGQVRSLLRGIAYDSDDSPAVLLGRLDGALDGLQLDTLATAVLARVELARGGPDAGEGPPVRRLRWTNAGHPPPLLRHPDGTVRILDGSHDLLLGVDPATVRAEHVVEMVAGSVVVLYTDGLIERRGDHLDDGIARLAETLAGEPCLDLEQCCEALLAAGGVTHQDDDIALLVLAVDDHAGDQPG